MTTTTKLPLPFHPQATDDMIVEAILDELRDVSIRCSGGVVSRAAARLSERYGAALVEKALRRRMQELRRERSWLHHRVAQHHRRHGEHVVLNVRRDRRSCRRPDREVTRVFPRPASCLSWSRLLGTLRLWPGRLRNAAKLLRVLAYFRCGIEVRAIDPPVSC